MMCDSPRSAATSPLSSSSSSSSRATRTILSSALELAASRARELRGMIVEINNRAIDCLQQQESQEATFLLTDGLCALDVHGHYYQSYLTTAAAVVALQQQQAAEESPPCDVYHPHRYHYHHSHHGGVDRSHLYPTTMTMTSTSDGSLTAQTMTTTNTTTNTTTTVSAITSSMCCHNPDAGGNGGSAGGAGGGPGGAFLRRPINVRLPERKGQDHLPTAIYNRAFLLDQDDPMDANFDMAVLAFNNGLSYHLQGIDTCSGANESKRQALFWYSEAHRRLLRDHPATVVPSHSPLFHGGMVDRHHSRWIILLAAAVCHNMAAILGDDFWDFGNARLLRCQLAQVIHWEGHQFSQMDTDDFVFFHLVIFFAIIDDFRIAPAA